MTLPGVVPASLAELQEPVREPDVVVREEFGARLRDGEHIARAAGAPAELRDGDVSVAEQDVEVASHRRSRQPELSREVLYANAIAAAQDTEDALARPLDAAGAGPGRC